ncbi:hypothetical protein OCOJLMKI_2818 [Methylobacterium iners]|uniref:HTH HARE-type domain-containing protein n=2 Tax=Methylobacterium iners TaxID=418707 RepID=A0ABQ4RYY4_9HYPH|nr:hypothetical protein OCOJLMKI_2818 [Methylobacterium iners]
MFLSEAEAEARLADLRNRRDALDRLIADHLLYLELGRRLPAAVGTDLGDRTSVERGPAVPSAIDEAPAPSPGPSPPREGELEPDGARQRGRALIAAVMAILTQAHQPLHARDILDRLTAQGFTLPGIDPVAALNTRLWKRSGPGGPLRRLGDAVYTVEAPGAQAIGAD